MHHIEKKILVKNFLGNIYQKKKLVYGINLNEKKLKKKKEKKKLDKYEKINFFKNLYKIGYSKVLNKNKNKNIKLLTKAFQRRFRQELINGIIDKECLLISKNLSKKKFK